jgi:hypothetical protein
MYTDTDGFIHVQFPKVEQGATDMMAACNALVSELESLEADLRKTVWNSGARQHFEDAKRVRQAKANDMAMSLQAFSGFLTDTHHTYRRTEVRNSSIWQGL